MGIVQDHADAYLGLLRATANLTVYPLPDGQDAGRRVPAGVLPPYVVVDVAIETLAGSSLDGLSDRVVARAFCHCVGQNDIACRAVAQLVRAALLNARPVVPGRAVGLIRHDANRPPTSDESSGKLVVEQTDIYRLETYPG
ncbi:hypothetical protein FJK98_02465 [Micromonospora sp. HM134]|uniref:hypothetical protein n=1 Tax=Micromonospora sp. HM134 TaxID=2583243 RepID=UPI0011985CEF|nr:hypothetical protein [Micromonospora sp. HM134]QDY06165.1 hypothetical protein FJK98_02465 [Micromonospora sp. HM134]